MKFYLLKHKKIREYKLENNAHYILGLTCERNNSPADCKSFLSVKKVLDS